MKPRPFDFNLHLVPRASNVDAQIQSEEALDSRQAVECYLALRGDARSTLSGINIMLFNQSWSHKPAAMGPISDAARADFGESAIFTQLVDFRTPPSPRKLATARKQGLRGIKFHSYVQKITPSDWPAALLWARAAQAEHLFVCIDTSFGTSGMYAYDNLHFAAWLAGEIADIPLILLHSGGLRAMEAWLLAESCPNVWLETSFSVPVYEGTRVEVDLASVYKKLSGKRVLYASDHPYIPLTESLKIFRRFLARHQIPTPMRELILHGNAGALLRSIG